MDALHNHMSLLRRGQSWKLLGRGCIFVGYDETSKDFHIYLLTQRKVVVRREVRFEVQASGRSLDSAIEEQQSTSQVTAQSSASQGIGSPVSGVLGHMLQVHQFQGLSLQ